MKQFHIHKDTMKYLTDNNLSLNAKGFLSIVLFNDGINSFDVQKYCTDNKETIKTTLLELRINKYIKYDQETKQLIASPIPYTEWDKEDVYAEVVGDLYDNKIISEKTFDKITGWDNEKGKEKDDYER